MRDTGFSVTKFTFQVTHATDDDANAERDFIIEELEQSRAIDKCTMGIAKATGYIRGGSITMSPTARSRRRAWP